MYGNVLDDPTECPRAHQVKRALRSGDVGNRAVGERQVGVPGPGRGTERRTALGCEHYEMLALAGLAVWVVSRRSYTGSRAASEAICYGNPCARS